MSLLGSFFDALFGKKQSKPKKKNSAAKKSRSTAKSGSSKSKAKKPMSANEGIVQVIGAQPPPRFSIPKAPTPATLMAESRAAWNPPGHAVRIGGRVIPDGMVYLGSRLESVSGHRAVDPALIDPKLPVANASPDIAGVYLSYWPSYSDLRPESRAAYLDWLQAGRPAGAPIGYVFLFFYGLERRALFDARHDPAARAEIPALIREVERLRRLYPENRSFQSYTSEFLVAALLSRGSVDPREIEPPMPDGSWELPLAARVSLGTFAADGIPIPPIWALSWLYCDPDTRLRTPARRCRQEFMTLFRLAYQKQFGQGMVLDPPKRRLALEYRPASAGFSGAIDLGSRSLPDVSQLRKPQSQLRAIADWATDQLDEYSRAIGSGRSGASPSTLAYLPVELGDISRFPAVAPLAAFLATSMLRQPTGLVGVPDLLAHFPELGPRPSQKQAAGISRLVQRLGYGLEPDPGNHRKAFVDSAQVGIYQLDPGHALPARNLDGAIGMLGLCALVARADGAMTSDEERAIVQQVERAYQLSPLEVRRTQAHLAWLATRPSTMSDARKRLAQLPPGSAEQTGRFLVTIAGIDGHVSPDEVRLLTRLYNSMGLSDQQLHSDLHTFNTRSGPTNVAEPKRAPSNQSPQERVEQSRPSHELDPAYLQLVQKQTAEISTVLQQVFTGEDAAEIAPDPLCREIESESAPPDADPYRELIEMLSARPTWEMSEISAMAGSLGLMAGGAIETLNDRALDLGLDPLLECDDICDVYEPTLKELLAHG